MPFDPKPIPRAYFFESTAALGALFNTGPGRDTLHKLAHELSFRSRPAAIKLLARVNEALGSRPEKPAKGAQRRGASSVGGAGEKPSSPRPKPSTDHSADLFL